MSSSNYLQLFETLMQPSLMLLTPRTYTLAFLFQFISQKPLHILCIGENLTRESEIIKKVEELYHFSKSSNLDTTDEYYFNTNFNSLSTDEMFDVFEKHTKVLASVKPDSFYYDAYGDIVEQTKLPKSILSKFDIILTFFDEADKKRDALHVDYVYENVFHLKHELDKDLVNELVNIKKITPDLNEEAKEYIKQYYVKMRNYEDSQNKLGRALSPRQIQSFLVLTSCFAQINLRTQVTLEDAKEGVELLQKYLDRVAVCVNTGQRDISRIYPYMEK